MPDNVIGKIPEFTQDDSSNAIDEIINEETGEEEVKEAAGDESAEEEKETPSELPADTEPESQALADTGELEKQLRGLQEEREKLLSEVTTLRGNRRTLKEEQLIVNQDKIDDLKDVHPDDIALFDRVLRAKGYVRKEETQEMYYKAVAEEEKDKFLKDFPEYKPENDSHDLNWNALTREFALFAKPGNPHDIYDRLLRAHNALRKPSERGTQEAQKRKINVASSGGGGTQRSSSKGSLNSRMRDELIRGGWSSEDIKEIEQELPE